MASAGEGSAAAVIRVGVVGLGANTAKHHVPKLLAQPGVRVVAVVNRTEASAAAAAAAAGLDAAAVVRSAQGPLRGVCEAADVDAVVIGSWPDTHLPLARAALAAGKHVLCEARLAATLAQAKQLLAAARQAQALRPSLVAQVVPAPFTLRFDATVQRCVADGTLGRVVAVDVAGVSGGFPETKRPMAWREDVAISGENIMMMGVFYECLVRWIGPAATVFAMGQTVVNMRTTCAAGDSASTTRLAPAAHAPLAARAVQVPDHLDITAKMVCGAQARLQFSAVAGGQAPEGNHITLFGTKASIRVVFPRGGGAGEPRLEIFRNPDEEHAASGSHSASDGDDGSATAAAVADGQSAAEAEAEAAAAAAAEAAAQGGKGSGESLPAVRAALMAWREGQAGADATEPLVVTGEWVALPLDEGTDIGWRVEEEFIGAIRGKEKIRLTTFEDGVVGMQFTHAVTTSLKSGRAEPVDDQLFD